MAEAQPTNHNAVRIMDDNQCQILIWPPSPIGDAVLCTPALRALRRRSKTSRITFMAQPAVRQVLSPGRFNDMSPQRHWRSPVAAHTAEIVGDAAKKLLDESQDNPE